MKFMFSLLKHGYLAVTEMSEYLVKSYVIIIEMHVFVYKQYEYIFCYVFCATV